MEDLAQENAGKLLIAQVQVGDNPHTTHRYQVGRTPAVVTVRGGQVHSQADAISGSLFEQHVAYLLGKGPKPRTMSSAKVQKEPGNGAAASAKRQGYPESRPRSANDATFSEVVMRSDLPVLVDFWAPWCGPCRMTEPILEKMAREMAGRLRVVKVNVDENQSTAQRYGIRSIPTMMMVKNGHIVDQWVGALPEAAMRSRVLTHI
jgi:thioredoxin 1